ncbi:hypothetical protein, partial [Desulfobacula sp.]|uniref:hypothetical protein n=1 Tax=Desulfobacula sp. TaxID=2593537 RepID=UPI002637807F
SFLALLDTHRKDNDGGYLEIIQGLPAAVSQEGVNWLNHIVDGFCRKTKAILPSLALFKG